MRDAHGLRAGDIERIELRVHPLVLELTGKKAPRTGLEGKFSVYHACAAGILFGQAGEAEFSDDDRRARRRDRAARPRPRDASTTRIDEAAADVDVTLQGRPQAARVRRARDRQPASAR